MGTLQKGESLNTIARHIERDHSSMQRILALTGGIRPLQRTRSAKALTLAEKEAISRGLASGLSMRNIAHQLQRAPSTISREIHRHGGINHYRAADRRYRRMGTRDTP